ncbi:flagellin [Thalassolituus sp.]|uniref:flagellin N-terminal helical domain-containing protein n=1 Tax=Thalassolituus sp. TaxID=2030822 RepID=UPI00351812A7
MPQIINTNIASLNAQRNLDKSQSANQQALQRLSSGLRINSAKDDAAGLAISTRFTSQIKGLDVAVRNAGDGIALAQTAEGALGSINESLQRIRELAVQSANATNSDVDREALQAEVDQLVSEISRTADETDFNGRKLLDGSFSATFQVGANAGQTVDISIGELTADKLGSSSQSGLSARGTDQSLGNGDLIINGVAVQASRAEDDTSSTSNNSASAISKVAAINRVSDETGVTAFVNENVAGGSDMTAESGTGSFKLNGVEISFATTTDAAQTRAAISQAINAVADQTGVSAVDTEASSTGVNLTAEDGRNIQISDVSFTGSDFAAATGLAAAGTYEGGYTLIADGDQKAIEISGGNGTGRGDLANAGLTAGSYDRAEAVSVSDKVADTSTSSTVSGGTLTNQIARTDDDRASLDGGSFANRLIATAETTTADTEFSVDVDGTVSNVQVAAGQTTAQAAATLDGVTGLDVQERIEFTVSDYATNAATAGSVTIAGATIALASSDSFTGATATEDRLTALADSINNATGFTAGVTVTAELNFDRDEILVTVVDDTQSGTGQTIVTDAATTSLTSADSAGAVSVSNTALTLQGSLEFKNTTAGQSVTVTGTEAGGAANAEILDDGTQTISTDGSDVLSTSGENQLTIKVGDAAPTTSTIAANSTVADLANTINSASNGVSAYEEINLTLDGSTLESGDALDIGGVNVSVSGAAGDLESLADDINSTDFSAANLDVSATLDANGDISLQVRNYSATEVTVSTEAEGRAVTATNGTDNFEITSVSKNVSGELKFFSDDGQDVSVTLSDPDVGGELYSGNSSSADYTGVNGLEDGDLLINGVTIGAADVNADKASATVSSDGARILSSEKSQSAIAIAAAINEVADETGVSAEVNATEVVGGDGTNIDLTQFEEGDQAGIYINGVEIGTVTLQTDGGGNLDSDRARTDALNLINQNAGKTGVTAVDNGVSLTLTAADGRNVSIAIDDKSGADASIGAVMGLDAEVDGIGEATFGAESVSGAATSSEAATYETTYGTVKLSSAKEFTLEGGANGNAELDAIGLATGTYGGGEDGQFLADIDISTFEGAQAAITAIDNAIGQVASQRADLGAIQNRLESTVSNLQVTSENLNAANSRIQDADFAAETAELSRTQVLQQAGISVLAQANAAGQQVLSLLG